jgi:hypothetical protein
MDDEDCERRRGECLDEMTDLEKQFHDLKDKYGGGGRVWVREKVLCIIDCSN